jgi:hypothetical protein
MTTFISNKLNIGGTEVGFDLERIKRDSSSQRCIIPFVLDFMHYGVQDYDFGRSSVNSLCNRGLPCPALEVACYVNSKRRSMFGAGIDTKEEVDEFGPHLPLKYNNYYSFQYMLRSRQLKKMDALMISVHQGLDADTSFYKVMFDEFEGGSAVVGWTGNPENLIQGVNQLIAFPAAKIASGLVAIVEFVSSMTVVVMAIFSETKTIEMDVEISVLRARVVGKTNNISVDKDFSVSTSLDFPIVHYGTILLGSLTNIYSVIMDKGVVLNLNGFSPILVVSGARFNVGTSELTLPSAIELGVPAYVGPLQIVLTEDIFENEFPIREIL